MPNVRLNANFKNSKLIYRRQVDDVQPQLPQPQLPQQKQQEPQVNVIMSSSNDFLLILLYSTVLDVKYLHKGGVIVLRAGVYVPTNFRPPEPFSGTKNGEVIWCILRRLLGLVCPKE